MTTSVSPVDPAAVLREAAAKVRKLGKAATPGPWERAMKTRTKSAIMAPTPDDAELPASGREHVAICSVPEWSAGAGFLRARSGRDLDWITLLGPQVAEALAASLEDDATRVGWAKHRAPSEWPTEESFPALRLARLLLGWGPS